MLLKKIRWIERRDISLDLALFPTLYWLDLSLELVSSMFGGKFDINVCMCVCVFWRKLIALVLVVRVLSEASCVFWPKQAVYVAICSGGSPMKHVGVCILAETARGM